MRMFGIITIVVLITAFSINAEELFPEPKALRSNVKFWTNVYSLYSNNEIIIHDKDSLHVVYTVVNLDDFYAAGTPERSKWEKVKKVKQHYRRILLSLAARKQPVDTTKLTDSERSVYSLWHDKNQFRTAAYNIRAQRGLKKSFREGLERSGRYMDKILAILKQHNVPSQLCHLPHVESSFNYKAYSKMGAAGIWQFTRYTGRLFLKIDYTIDQRMDPFDATEAAARLLTKNYKELSSWPLAITAYNHGLGGMKRAKARLKTSDMGTIVKKYKSRSFGFASKNFYAEFLAAKHVAENYVYYFGHVTFDKPIQVQTLALQDYVTLESLARIFQMDSRELAAFNPSFRRPIIENKRRVPRGYLLKLPVKENFDPAQLYANLPAEEKFADQVRDAYYKVQPGDNLYKIARKYGTTVNRLAVFNNLASAHRIRVGQILEIPSNAEQTVVPPKPAVLAQKEPEIVEVKGGGLDVQPPEPVAETVKPAVPSDSVITVPEPVLAGVVHGPQAPAKFLQSDGRDTSGTASAFQIDINEPVSDWITVHPEETIGHYADWLGMPAGALRKINGMPFGREIQVGQRLKLSFNQVGKKDFHARRMEYHRGIQEDFFQHFKVVSVEMYTVRSGDNIWSLAQGQFRVPFWLLKRYNKEKDLLRLYPGDRIFAPVVAPLQNQAVSDEMAE